MSKEIYSRQNKVINRIRKATGLNAVDFCNAYLDAKPTTFYQQLRTGTLRLSDIKKVLAVTGCTFEELFLGREPVKIIAKPESTIKEQQRNYRRLKQKEVQQREALERSRAEEKQHQAEQKEKKQELKPKSFLDLM